MESYYQQCLGYQNPALTKDCNLAAGKKARRRRRGRLAAPIDAVRDPALPVGGRVQV